MTSEKVVKFWEESSDEDNINEDGGILDMPANFTHDLGPDLWIFKIQDSIDFLPINDSIY